MNLHLDANRVSRRSFLKAGAAFGGGLVIGWVPEGWAADPEDASQPFSPNAFVRIDRAGKVTVVSPSVEMGQGTYTSISQILAGLTSRRVDGPRARGAMPHRRHRIH